MSCDRSNPWLLFPGFRHRSCFGLRFGGKHAPRGRDKVFGRLCLRLSSRISQAAPATQALRHALRKSPIRSPLHEDKSTVRSPGLPYPLLILRPRPIIRHGHASKTLCFSVAPRARSERPLQGAIFHAVLERVRAESARRRWQMTYRLKTVRVQFIAEPESDERGCAPAV